MIQQLELEVWLSDTQALIELAQHGLGFTNLHSLELTLRAGLSSVLLKRVRNVINKQLRDSAPLKFNTKLLVATYHLAPVDVTLYEPPMSLRDEVGMVAMGAVTIDGSNVTESWTRLELCLDGVWEEDGTWKEVGMSETWPKGEFGAMMTKTVSRLGKAGKMD